jgi:hypothetical protein
MRQSFEAVLRPLFFGTILGMTGAFVGCAGAPVTPASPANAAAQSRYAAPAGYTFRTIGSDLNESFNQLLSINDGGTIAGYYNNALPSGKGNKGYTIAPSYSQKDFTYEDYPKSTQTQVIGINNLGTTVGFYTDTSGAVHGFVDSKGTFTAYNYPRASGTTINSINDAGIAAGFYTDSSGENFGFTLNVRHNRWFGVKPPHATNVTASAINASGDVDGFYGPASSSVSFLRKAKKFYTLTYPGSTNTMALGINADDAIVGTYTNSSGVHGFLLTHPTTTSPTWTTIDDPKGVGTTMISGINDNNEMVGFYMAGSYDTYGMLIKP